MTVEDKIKAYWEIHPESRKYGRELLARAMNISPNSIKAPLAKLKRENKSNSEPEYKRGFEEQKPKYDDYGEYYIVYAGSGEYRREIEITKADLRKLKQLYCDDSPLTINELCRELNIPRADFHVIKTAFGITHNDVPYPDDEITDDNIDELVEETLERRKHKYFTKLQHKEVESLRQEVAKYREKDYFLNKIHESVTEHFLKFAENYSGPTIPLLPKNNSGKMLEVSIVDLHLGKLAWCPETGNNYDHKIAEKRFMSVILDVINNVKDMQFEQVLFPIGNDFFNFDTHTGTTTGGTAQDNDLRWQKLLDKGVELLVRGVDVLCKIAPVKVILVPGNHDKMMSYFGIKFLQAWFRNDLNVTVETDPKTRKYIEFGKCLIGFTHMDKEKKRIFGNMQLEAPESWGRTKYREWHGAHLHSEQVKEGFGITVRNLTSVTGTDAWHFENGYTGAIARSQSFIWDKEKGLKQIMYSIVE